MTAQPVPQRDPTPYAERVIMTAGRAVRNAYDARFKRLDLNMTEGALLATIRRFGPLTQRELAELLYIGRAAAGQFVDRLEARGLVQRDTDPDDRRVWIVSTTREGKAVSIEAFDIYFKTAADLTHGLTDAQRERMIKLLLSIQGNAEEIASEP
ncbi:MAG TPA: MarR family transcriptional regulator [Streptosporangiaceae bacterium]|nr:MarR family transcriptional regulator [Streptosporangiaceae bacterium]